MVQNRLQPRGRYCKPSRYGDYILFRLGLLASQSGNEAVDLWLERNLGAMTDSLAETDFER